MKIIYKSELDQQEFDINKFLSSLNRYGKVTKQQIEKELKKYEGYSVLHNSVLVEIGVKLLPDEDSARAYFEDHPITKENFTRLARITGYLTTDVSRWNLAKMQEWSERTVSSINNEYSPENKALLARKKKILREQYLNVI